MAKRSIEVFVAGCPMCDETVKLVRGLACPSCDVRIHDLRSDTEAHHRAKRYGLNRVPAVVVDGKLASCCSSKAVDIAALRALGLGSPLPT